MTYKAAAAGLDLGGGKAVIIGDSKKRRPKTAGARTVGSLRLSAAGITAEDVGTALEDMDVVRRESKWVTGCSHTYGGSGDPSPVTAWGVLQGIKACLLEVTGDPTIAGRTVAIQGVGKVGHALCGYLTEEGAKVSVADVDVDNLARAVRDFQSETTPLDTVHSREVDIFAPCALGGGINDDTISESAVRHRRSSQQSACQARTWREAARSRHPLRADFVINAGGLMNVEDELRGYDRDRAMKRVEGIYKQLQYIFTMAREKGISTAQAANDYAEDRIRKISRIRLVRNRIRPSLCALDGRT